ncbi:hypothetical protein ACOMHN_024608 [Nucella lapillus]
MLSLAIHSRDLLVMAVVKKILAAAMMLVLTDLKVGPGCGAGGAAIRTVEVGPGLTHLTVDRQSGAVYVGGVNKVYELSQELQVVQEAVTGPRMDSPDCLPPPQVCTFPRHLTDNHNKLLVLLPRQHLLVTCGSVFQGACETRPLFNLSQPHPYYTAEDVTNIAVVANSPESSTVGFVAPGVGGEEVLYVAATYTGTSRTSRLYRDQVPALSSRSLHEDHRFALASFTSPLRGKSSAIFLKNKVRVTFPIRYVTGFSHAGFSYFLTVQHASVEGEEVVGEEGEGEGLRSANWFRMSEVRFRLLQNIKLCHHGNTSVSGGGYLRVGPRGNCNRPSGLVVQRLESGEHYLCNSNLESFSNVVGILPVLGRPILQFLGQRVTALTLTHIHGYTVAFLGTDIGRLKKVVVTSAASGRQYREDQVTSEDSDVILKDIVMDARHRHLYLLTHDTISKVAVEDCGSRTTCPDCLREEDPYCGWCSLETRCTVQALCPHAAERREEGRWLQGEEGGGDLCIHITSITPTSASVAETTQLHLTIPQLPAVGDCDYRCVWAGTGWSPVADLWYFGARCLTPDFSALNMSLDTEGSRVLTLGLLSTETHRVFLTANFTVFNCSNFRTCTECTESAFDCHWCVHDNGCYHDTHACQPVIVAGKSSSREGARGATLCPRVDTQLTGAIFVPEGVTSTIMLIGHNLPSPEGEKGGYRCEVITGSHVYTAPGHRLDDRQLTCSLPQSRGTEAVHSVDLAVYWGQHFRLDTTARLVVRLYRCGVVGEGQCSVCVHLNVWPMSGPVGGGTKVTIEGRDLGIRFKDIEKGVEIGGVPCLPFVHLYLPARRIVCRLEGRGQEGAWPVQVTVTPHHPVTFTRLFYFRSHARRPHQGPVSGSSPGLTASDPCRVDAGALWGLCWTILFALFSDKAVRGEPDDREAGEGGILGEMVVVEGRGRRIGMLLPTNFYVYPHCPLSLFPPSLASLLPPRPLSSHPSLTPPSPASLLPPRPLSSHPSLTPPSPASLLPPRPLSSLPGLSPPTLASLLPP